MQQYKPTFVRYLLIHFLSYLGAFVLLYFIVTVLPFQMSLAEYLVKMAFFVIVLTFVALFRYEHYTIEVKDGRVTGPGYRWKRLDFPVTEIDWSKSVFITGWQRWLKDEQVVSTRGDKILVHVAFTKQQRENLLQGLRQVR